VVKGVGNLVSENELIEQTEENYPSSISIISIKDHFREEKKEESLKQLVDSQVDVLGQIDRH
jgi:hypothetical protein